MKSAIVNFRAPEAMVARIHEAREDGEDVSEFVRFAVRQELDRRTRLVGVRTPAALYPADRERTPA